MKTKLVAAIGAALLLVLVLLFGYLALSRTKPILTVATWPEEYGHAQRTAQLVPFSVVSGTNVLMPNYEGGTDALARQVASRRYDWDVMDMELPDAVTACNRGLLEPIDGTSLPPAPSGQSAASDFVPGAIGPCWVASMVYSQVIAYSPEAFAAHRPATLADFFDTAAFPGKRAINSASAKMNLEMALLADGVPPGEVYALLTTPQGVARALSKLDSLRGNLVWYRGAAEAARMVASGEAAMAAMPNWAVFDADNDVNARFKLGIIWDRQLYQLEVFGIPKGNPKRAKAMQFIRYATAARVLGTMSSWVAYGPARKSALGFVGDNPELKIAMAPYLPTAHFNGAFAVDEAWWRLHGADIAPLWQEFVAKSGG